MEPDEADGKLKDIYKKLEQRRGKLARIHKIQSLNPETITTHMDLYMSIMFTRSPLSRAQREMMAVVVSATNDCEYCKLHHGEVLNHYWKDQERIEQLRSNYNKLDLNDVDKRLCQLARELTLDPHSIEEDNYITPLKNADLSDRAILIGVDLKKDIDVLEAAYNDHKSVTAAFNKNILHHINRKLDGTFDSGNFKHHAFFNADEGRIEMHLIAQKDHSVTVTGEDFSFQKGESIHTENSYKYSIEEFEELVSLWFTVKEVWTDANNYFSTQYLQRT
nr:L-histidine N(alpha)-methyltransferase [Aliifodinibius salipaludis]